MFIVVLILTVKGGATVYLVAAVRNHKERWEKREDLCNILVIVVDIAAALCAAMFALPIE